MPPTEPLNMRITIETPRWSTSGRYWEREKRCNLRKKVRVNDKARTKPSKKIDVWNIRRCLKFTVLSCACCVKTKILEEKMVFGHAIGEVYSPNCSLFNYFTFRDKWMIKGVWWENKPHNCMYKTKQRGKHSLPREKKRTASNNWFKWCLQMSSSTRISRAQRVFFGKIVP